MKTKPKKNTNSQIQKTELPEGGVGGGPNGSRGSEGKLSSYKVSESWNLSCETPTKFTECWQVRHTCGQAGHPQGGDNQYLQICKLHGRLSLEAQGLRNEGVQILQTESVHLHGKRASISPGRTQAQDSACTYTYVHTHSAAKGTHTQGCMCACTNSHTHTHVHTRSEQQSTHTNVCTCTLTHACVPRGAKVHAHTHTNTYTHAHSG